MQLPLSGKLYLLKLASNHLFCPWVSIAVSGLGRLCCFHSSPWGWRNHSQTLCVGRISQPDSSSHTNWSSTNISWMEWLGCLEFQSWPSLQRLFFPHPWLSSWMFPIKTHSCQSYSKMNKSLEIAGKQRDHPLARGKAGVWSYQIWFVSRAVAATAQGSGDCCGESFFRLNCGTGVMTHWHRTSCLLCLGLSNLHRLNMGVGGRKYGCGAGESVWLNILLFLNFYCVTIFQITAFRETLIPTASVLCPTCITCSSVTCIDFLS